MRLLEQAALALEKGDRPGRWVLVGMLADAHNRSSSSSRTHLFLSSLIGLISILRRPMARACIERHYV
jgi:hypothetical protein